MLLIMYMIVHRRTLYEKRISQEVNGEDLGEEFAGYVSCFIGVPVVVAVHPLITSICFALHTDLQNLWW